MPEVELLASRAHRCIRVFAGFQDLVDIGTERSACYVTINGHSLDIAWLGLSMACWRLSCSCPGPCACFSSEDLFDVGTKRLKFNLLVVFESFAAMLSSTVVRVVFWMDCGIGVCFSSQALYLRVLVYSSYGLNIQSW